MKKICFLIVLMMLSCILTVSATQNSATDELTILFTHDMHSHLMPSTAEVNGEIIEFGGFARLKTAIDEQKSQRDNVLLVDAGDFSMGTLFQTIYSTEASELRLLGELGYEAVTLGNHEFDYRGNGLAEMLTVAKEKGENLPYLTASNIVFSEDSTDIAKAVQKAMDEYGAEEYFIIDKNGIKIAVFGIMGYDSIECSPMAQVEFADTIESAEKTVKKIKENEDADIIVCLSHSGTWSDPKKSEDEILAQKVPDIDVIISGHTHTALTEPKVIGNTYIASVGEYCTNLGSMTLRKDADNRWEIVDYALIPINENVKDDEEMLNMISAFKDEVQTQYLDRYNMKFDQVIAYNPYRFTPLDKFGKTQKEDTLGNIIADSYIYAVKNAEGDDHEPIAAAIAPNGVIRGSLTQGDITVADAFNISSLGIGKDELTGYPLLSIYLTGKELKAVAEVDASVTPIMSYAQLYINGLSYEFNPNRLIFNKITDISLVNEDGTYEEIDDDKLYRVVSGLYSAQMLNAVNSKSFGILSVTPKTKDGTPVEDFEEQIIEAPYGEIKEWYALASYMMSFEQENGVSVIPEYYSTTHNRKIVNDSKSIIELVKNPNKVFFVVVGVIIILIVILILIIRLIIKSVRKRRSKRLKG